MQKALIGLLAAFLAASCSTTTAPTALAPKPAQAASAETQTLSIGLPSFVKTFYPNGDLSGLVKTVYDQQGRLLTQETQNANGVVLERRLGETKGKLWRVTVLNVQTGEIASFEELLYGPGGVLLSQTLLDAKGAPQSANEFIYEKGKKISWVAKTGSGSVQASTKYLYDARGNNIRTEISDGAGKLVNVFTSTFSSEGHILTRLGADTTGAVTEQTTFTWDGARKMKEETSKPVLRSVEYQYTDQDQPSAVVSSVRGKVVEKQSFEYQWIKTVQNQ